MTDADISKGFSDLMEENPKIIVRQESPLTDQLWALTDNTTQNATPAERFNLTGKQLLDCSAHALEQHIDDVKNQLNNMKLALQREERMDLHKPNIPCETRIRNFDEVFRIEKRTLNEPQKAGKHQLKEKGNKDIKDDLKDAISIDLIIKSPREASLVNEN